MQAISAGTRSRWLRMGVAAGAASIGAVALSVILGGAAANASEHDPGGLGEAVQQAGSSLETAVDSVSTRVGDVAPSLASLEPVMQPVTSIVEPVTSAIVAPVVGVADGALDAVHPVDALLGEAPVDTLVAPLGDTDLGSVEHPVVAPGSGPGAVPADPHAVAPVAPALGLDVSAAPPLAVVPEAVPATDPAAEPTASARLMADARPMPSSGAAVIAPIAAAVADVRPGPGGDGLLAPAGSPVAEGVAPSGASGTPGGSASPSAIVHDHSLPAPAVGEAGALEHDRALLSLIEEHTARPD